jgi:hypothetical protein
MRDYLAQACLVIAAAWKPPCSSLLWGPFCDLYPLWEMGSSILGLLGCSLGAENRNVSLASSLQFPQSPMFLESEKDTHLMTLSFFGDR